MPRATSSAIDPVGMTSIGRAHLVAEAHDRALAELPLDLRERGVERLLAVGCCHGGTLSGSRRAVSGTRSSGGAGQTLGVGSDSAAGRRPRLWTPSPRR